MLLFRTSVILPVSYKLGLACEIKFEVSIKAIAKLKFPAELGGKKG